MKTIAVPSLKFNSDIPDLAEVSYRLDMHNVRNSISEVNWERFPYKPKVEFSIAYTESELMIKYFVTEDFFKAEMTETNQNVFEDSCVEFFFSPSDDGIYYNLEFNGIGTCLVGMGASRSDRIRIDPDIIGTIRRKSSAGEKPVSRITGGFTWELVAAIPWEVFYKHKIIVTEGSQFRANFYKCGDKLETPHYLTWNRIPTEKPDFHRPEYFGTIVLKA